jgi:hypothetical protein
MMLLALVAHSPCFAQTPGAAYLEPLSEEEYEPTASLSQVQTKDYYSPAEYGTNAQINALKIRPILAIPAFSIFPLRQVVRFTIRIVTAPKGKRASTETGYGDSSLLDLFVMPWPNPKTTQFSWGIGPYLIFPTATIQRAGRGAWRMGPSASFSYRGIQGLDISGLLRNAISFAYTSPRSVPVSSLTFQPIVTYQLWRAWYLKSSEATWEILLRHNTRTTIPLDAGFGRVWQISESYAVDTSVSAMWMPYRQFARRSRQFTVIFRVDILMPNLKG